MRGMFCIDVAGLPPLFPLKALSGRVFGQALESSPQSCCGRCTCTRVCAVPAEGGTVFLSGGVGEGAGADGRAQRRVRVPESGRRGVGLQAGGERASRRPPDAVTPLVVAVVPPVPAAADVARRAARACPPGSPRGLPALPVQAPMQV